MAAERSLWRWWTLAFVVGELVGFVPPAATGAALAAAGARDPALVGGLVAAGIVEGAVLGSAQAWVLARHLPAVDGRRWVAATAAAAGFAWLVGMVIGTLGAAGRLAPVVMVALFVPAGAAALLGMGFAQWLVLRSAVPRSTRWIWVNAAAWLVGVMIPVAALSLAPDGWPLWAHAVVGVLAAVAMGLTVGAVTGRTLVTLLRRA